MGKCAISSTLVDKGHRSSLSAVSAQAGVQQSDKRIGSSVPERSDTSIIQGRIRRQLQIAQPGRPMPIDTGTISVSLRAPEITQNDPRPRGSFCSGRRFCSVPSVNEPRERSLLPFLEVGNNLMEVVMMPRCIGLAVLPYLSNNLILIFHLYPPEAVLAVCRSLDIYIQLLCRWI